VRLIKKIKKGQNLTSFTALMMTDPTLCMLGIVQKLHFPQQQQKTAL
jgi:hypothetical protein